MMLAGSVPPRFLWGAETSWDLGELLPLPNQRADIRLPMASATHTGRQGARDRGISDVHELKTSARSET